MPPAQSSMQTANDFNRFFIEKIERLKARFQENSNHSYLDGQKLEHTMSEFQRINLEKAKRLINAAPSKTCALDPVPTHIVKSVSHTLGPVNHKIINMSLAESKVPSSFKTAIVKPLLKKPDLDTIHKNYRPVSNLAFI